MNTRLPDTSLDSYFRPGQPWFDTNGQPINAHGGGVIFHKGRYYWYGEHKLPGKSEADKADGGVHCYASNDLYHWQDQGVVLSVDEDQPESEIAYGCILERPKVSYRQATGRFVMYFKLYPKHQGYEQAYVGVAESDSPTGPFVYRHRFLAGGNEDGSGDYALCETPDGVTHHMAVRKPDKALVAAPLTADGLNPAGDYRPLPGITRHTEGLAIFHFKGQYWLLGSGSSGWEPNAARSFVADDLYGPWTPLGNPAVGTNPQNSLGPDKTFGGQSSCVFQVSTNPNVMIAMLDIWRPKRPIEGGYIWLPVTFTQDRFILQWQDTWRIEADYQI